MNNFLRLSFCIVFLSTNLLSQSEDSDYKKFQLSAKLGYNVPFKESFRKNYDQSFFVGSSDIPLSINIGIAYRMSNNLALFLEGGRSKYKLTPGEDVSLSIHPLTVGIHYFLPHGFPGLTKFAPYIGTGVNFNWAVFNVKYFQTDVEGNQIDVVEESKTYTGFGLDFDFGIDYQLGRSIFVGLLLKINPNRVGDPEKGGLGNIGGFTIFGKFGLKL